MEDMGNTEFMMSVSHNSRFYSSSFSKIYDALPSDAQRELLESHLIPLLDRTGISGLEIVNAATRLQNRFTGMPDLNYIAKGDELDNLIEELDSDAKHVFLKERFRREELLSEIMDSLCDWMNDIWSVVYEYKTNFDLAHKCLRLAATTLTTVTGGAVGCKCSVLNMPVSVVIKDKNTRKTVKSFHLIGAHNFSRVLLWVWRDLFLSLLTHGPERQKKQIPKMLADIEDAMGWNALERLLIGGLTSIQEDEDDMTDCGDDDDEWYDEDDDDANYDSQSHNCPFYADHWPVSISRRLDVLSESVEQHLISIFRMAPSLPLYSSIQTVTTRPTAQTQLQKLAEDTALTCSDSFIATIDIFSFEGRTEKVVALLDQGKHLLRPRDAPILQSAVASIGNNRLFRPRMLAFIEHELLDTVQTIRAALLSVFSGISNKEHLTEVQGILRLQHGSTMRQDRVDRWIDAVATPGASAPHPMAFAAMMMGIPLPPGADVETGEADPLGLLDMDEADPDLEDLREEFKPRMKQRLQGWIDTATTIPGGTNTLLSVFKNTIDTLPFLLGNDIVEELLSRLSDKPNKHHVGDALEALHSFAKVQRKKFATAMEKKRRKDAAKNATNASGSSSGSSSANLPPPPPLVAATFQTFGGIEDVD